MAVRLLYVALLFAALLGSGSLGTPALRDEVVFDHVRQAHFDAVGVTRERGEGSSGLLVVYVRVMGDARDADLSPAARWLEAHAGVSLRERADGAPLYLTRHDLSATSGRATLGATVPTGMAVELTNGDVGACVLAHEVLHFLGLRHVDDASNLMYPHCSTGFLERATLSADQTASLSTLQRVEALTFSGVQVWAARG